MMQAAFPDAPAETAKLPRRNPGEATLRKLLAEYSRLAAVAKQAHDVDSYRTWSAACERVSMSLLPHELPRLNAVATTKLLQPGEVTTVTFNVFQKDRRERMKLIEATPVDATASEVLAPPERIERRSANAAALEPDRETAAASPPIKEPPAKPEEPKPAPPQSPSDGNAYAVGSGKSLFEHPSLSPLMRYGARHH
jgi:hypothetical protein